MGDVSTRPGPLREPILVHPEDYVSSERQLSVLSPVGTALIGIKVGDRMPYLSIEGAFHVVIAVSVNPPLKIVSFAQNTRRVHINSKTKSFDPGPQAA